jgi:hypothetical protein
MHHVLDSQNLCLTHSSSICGELLDRYYLRVADCGPFVGEKRSAVARPKITLTLPRSEMAVWVTSH